MIAKEAKTLARRWVNEEGAQIPGFAGAFFHGSTNWLADDAPIAPTSDVDVLVVLDGPEPERKPGKFMYHGAMLEISFVRHADVASAEQVLGVSHMAGSFFAPSIIADPSEHLTAIHEAVVPAYAQRRWVLARCENVVDKILNNLRGLDTHQTFHEQVSAWLFATGLTTHVLLVAALKNPTVRKRYEAVRDMLHERGHDEFYPPLLELLGCPDLTRERVEHHMDALTRAFDATADIIRSPFFFAADISPDARAVPIDGSWELIRRGDHREAIFWMVATYARCLKVLDTDAPALSATYEPGFRALVGDLGIASLDDMRERSADLVAFLPRLREMAQTIVDEHPDVVR